MEAKYLSISSTAHKIYYIGNNAPVKLMDFIRVIEGKLKIRIDKQMLPMQDGNVPSTYANVQGLVEDLGYKPEPSILVGVSRFVSWYLDFFNVDLESKISEK